MKKLFALLVLICPAVIGQSFEVASVRPSEPGQRREVIGTDPGRFNMSNISLRRCIEWAYELGTPLELSAPDWMNDVRFDIAARAADHNANDDQLRTMLKNLLTDRFGVKLHHERKEQRVYIMTQAKGGLRIHMPNGKDSSKLVESSGNGDIRFSEDKTGAMAEHVTMTDIARKISPMLNAIVYDETGAKGHYDLRIDISPYLLAASDGGGGEKPDIMSILFTGFSEQLGVKFDAGKRVVDLIVIDSANRAPTEN